MNSITRRNLVAGVALLAAFALLTVLVQLVDVRPVGQNGTNVGFATFNIWFHGLTGVHMRIYTTTDWLGLVPIAISLGFTAMGAVQLVRRRSLLKVDPDILLLGVYYIAVIFFYLLFEAVPINYRPVPVDGAMEASYSSSTTLLVLSVMPARVVLASIYLLSWRSVCDVKSNADASLQWQGVLHGAASGGKSRKTRIVR